MLVSTCLGARLHACLDALLWVAWAQAMKEMLRSGGGDAEAALKEELHMSNAQLHTVKDMLREAQEALKQAEGEAEGLKAAAEAGQGSASALALLQSETAQDKTQLESLTALLAAAEAASADAADDKAELEAQVVESEAWHRASCAAFSKLS